MPQQPRIASRTRHEIRDCAGVLHAVHVRVDGLADGKSFHWQRPDGTSGLGGRPVASLPLYRSERVALLDADEPVYLAEGEKAADALAHLGFHAVGTVTGAASASDDDALAVLANRDVRLWPDNDEAGNAHMSRIAIRLIRLGSHVGFVRWSNAPDHGDAADFVASGGTSDALRELPIVDARLLGPVWAERKVDDDQPQPTHAARLVR